MKIAVIGAGLAGLTAAKQLHSAGAEVTVFDKSKGTGGRLSSRSFAGGWIDHGAPYVSLESDQFSSFLKQNMSIAGVTDLQKTLRDKHACGTKPATGCL